MMIITDRSKTVSLAEMSHAIASYISVERQLVTDRHTHNYGILHASVAR